KSVKIHKLQKEKVEFERYTTTAQVTRENEKAEEIQMLKQQIAGLQEEFRRNESHWQAAHGKLRNQIDTLTKQNLELQDELRVSEHQRLEAKGQSGAAVDFTSRQPDTLVLADLLPVVVVKCLRQRTCGRKSPVPVTHLSVFKETNTSSSTKGKIFGVEQMLIDGRKIITFRNGTKKEISADTRTTVVMFFNGDIKKIMPDQRVIYYYADAQTAHTTYPSGLEVLRFPNNQIEKHYPDGTKEIVFPDQTVKRFSESGLEETVFPDGTVVKVEKNGDKMVLFSNGQKEIHTAQFKRREYPDGTIKTVYSSGQQETKYSSGRVRIKDEEGNIILDKK
uniref:Centromere protein J C-terminal domain-containing protein n=1 Tax=Sphenodon punctatus TaxID=8508 RepID=A0A8D0GCH1_SPHPU